MSEIEGTAPINVLIAGGGSAGHVEPALAIADAIMARRPGSHVVALGTANGLEARLVPARGYALATVEKVVMPRKPSLAALSFPRRLREAVRQAGGAIDAIDADVVIGVGGYASAPAYLAARKRKVPIVVHEANAMAGWANKLGARFTSFVAITHPSTALRHARLTGLPVRAALMTLDRDAGRTDARLLLGLDRDLPTLLVTGGSLGARRLNQSMVEAAIEVTQSAQVLHITGLAAADEVRASIDAALQGSSRARYVVLAYADKMELAYAAADFAITRGGANTCAELASVGLPALIVPLPIGNGEQRINAEPLVEAGGALIVDDAALSADYLVSTVMPLLGDPVRRAEMTAALRALPTANATESVMALIDEALASRATPRDTRADEPGAG